MPDDTLTFLADTFRKIAEAQRFLAAEWADSGSPEGIEYARGYADAFDKAAEIVTRQLPSTNTKES